MSSELITSKKIIKDHLVVFSKSEIKVILRGSGFDIDTNLESCSKRDLIERVYESVNWDDLETIKKLICLIEAILYDSKNSNDEKHKFKTELEKLGFKFDGNKVVSQNLIFDNTVKNFTSQFPAGLPFGKLKPNIVVKGIDGSQSIKFELQDGIGIINKNVYPNFTYKNLANHFNVELDDKNFRISLGKMNQTKCEETFFSKYSKTFKIRCENKENVPVLIPQAWIQWHSEQKKYLDSRSSLGPNDIYRVDFVAFWNNKRFVFCIDDPNHYATQEKYSNTLNETRMLMSEGWSVIRISNWEIMNDEKLTQIINSLPRIMNFL